MTNKLKAHMIKENISQQFLAEKLNICKSSMSRKLNGSRSFRVEELTQICNILGLELVLNEEENDV